MTVLKVFPQPRHVSVGGSGAPASTPATAVADSTIPSQGYHLHIGQQSIDIRHSDDAGLRYGQHTLTQLRQQYRDHLPELTIKDWPDTLERAYMLDISRDRVPTMETLAWLVGVLAASRINQLQLYTEHTFAFADHETVWRDASPMTAAEMTSLDQLCADNGIELVPCLNVFGHMGPWLTHDEYRDRAECPDGFDIPAFDTHLDPLTLEPTQSNADFALELVRELCATVTTNKVNICCDEALELGLGRSKEQVAERGKGHVFTDHLLRLLDPLIADGHDVLFWGDMFRIDPEPLSRLPRDHAQALAWQYDPPGNPGEGMSFLAMIPGVGELLGFPDDVHLGFESQTRQLANADYPFMVAPGTGSWNSLIGRWPHAQANLLDAVDVGLKAGASGMVLTDWGDNGHMQPLAISVLPIAYGGAVAWCVDTNRNEPSATEIDRVFFGGEGAGIAAVLANLGGLAEQCGRTAINGSALFYDLLIEPPIPAFGQTTADDLAAVIDGLTHASTDLDAAEFGGEQAVEIKQEILAAIRLARHGAWRIGRLMGLDNCTDAVMRTDLAEAIEMQRAAWLGRARPGGLEHSIGLLETTLKTYEQ